MRTSFLQIGQVVAVPQTLDKRKSLPGSTSRDIHSVGNVNQCPPKGADLIGRGLGKSTALEDQGRASPDRI